MASNNKRIPFSSVPLSVLHAWQDRHHPNAKQLEQTNQGVTNNISVPQCAHLVDVRNYLVFIEAKIGTGRVFYLDEVAKELRNCSSVNTIMLSKDMEAYQLPIPEIRDEPRGTKWSDFDERPQSKPIQKSPALSQFPAAIYDVPPPPKKKILFSAVPMSQVSTWNKFCLPKSCFGKINSMITKKPFSPVQNSFMDHWIYCSAVGKGLLLEDYASFLLAIEDCPNAIALSQAIFDYIEGGSSDEPKHEPKKEEPQKTNNEDHFYPPVSLGRSREFGSKPVLAIPKEQWMAWDTQFKLSQGKLQVIFEHFVSDPKAKYYLRHGSNLQDLVSEIYIKTKINLDLAQMVLTLNVKFRDSQTQDLIDDMENYLRKFGNIWSYLLIFDESQPSVCRPSSPPPPKPVTQPPSVVVQDDQPSSAPVSTTLSDDQPVVLPILEPVKFKGCVICEERDNDAVLLPCSHGFCFECSSQVPRCPTCNTQKSSVLRIFLS